MERQQNSMVLVFLIPVSTNLVLMAFPNSIKAIRIRKKLSWARGKFS